MSLSCLCYCEGKCNCTNSKSERDKTANDDNISEVIDSNLLDNANVNKNIQQLS